MLYRLERVQKSFGTKPVLTGATWQHDPGRVAGLVGRNGAGKSTLLRVVQGLVEPDAGQRPRAGGTTFASLEQAVEPEGDEPLREFVARAQEGLRGLEARDAPPRGGDRRRLLVRSVRATEAVEPLLAEHDAVRERFERNGGYEADARVERVLLGVGAPAARPGAGPSASFRAGRSTGRRWRGSSSATRRSSSSTSRRTTSTWPASSSSRAWLVERKQSAAQAALVVSHDRQLPERRRRPDRRGRARRPRGVPGRLRRVPAS